MSKTKRTKLANFLLILLLALAVSFALLGALSWQMAKGQDPVLGAKAERPVVYKKILVTKQITEPRRTVYRQADAPTYQSATSSPVISSYEAPSYQTPVEPVVSSAS